MTHTGILDAHIGLYTDFYELVMAQGYFAGGRVNTRACFDYFFRSNPFDGGYAVTAGMPDVLDLLERLRFGGDDLSFLKSLGFHDDFLEYLEGFSFHGTIHACVEGEIAFPLEPIARVEGNIIETQIIETLLLNMLNFESLIATKSARCCYAAGPRRVVEFGLRRAQGPAGLLASRAACIGGAVGTSNVLSAMLYDLPPSGTQAHSWVQSYSDELASFQAYAEAYPEQCILLVDTYDTLKSGVPNAIFVAKEMESRGQHLYGIRLDSGDLAYLSKRARRMLNEAGLPNVKIIVSNRLDEHIIKSLLDQGAPIDAFGVGTALATGNPDAALDGVYKLSAVDGTPRMKISENPEKMSLPGIKQVFRCVDRDGNFVADGVALVEETGLHIIHHPVYAEKKSDMRPYKQEPLYQKVMENGGRILKTRSVKETAEFTAQRLSHLPEEHKRFDNPHVYRVGITSRLMDLRNSMVARIREGENGRE